jgi:hypothetical protein
MCLLLSSKFQQLSYLLSSAYHLRFAGSFARCHLCQLLKIILERSLCMAHVPFVASLVFSDIQFHFMWKGPLGDSSQMFLLISHLVIFLEREYLLEREWSDHPFHCVCVCVMLRLEPRTFHC